MLGIRTTADRAVHAVEGQRWLDQPGYRLERMMALGFNLLGERRSAAAERAPRHVARPSDSSGTDRCPAWGVAARGWSSTESTSSRPARAGSAGPPISPNGVGILGGFGAAGDRRRRLAVHPRHRAARRVGARGVIMHPRSACILVSWLARRRRGMSARRGEASASWLYSSPRQQAYLGGDLVLRHRIGVDRSEISLEPREFVPVLASRPSITRRAPQGAARRGGGGACPPRREGLRARRASARTCLRRCRKAGSTGATWCVLGTDRTSTSKAAPRSTVRPPHPWRATRPRIQDGSRRNPPAAARPNRL